MLSLRSFTTLTATMRMFFRLIGKLRTVTLSSSSCMSEKMMMVFVPAAPSFRNSAPWISAPVMSVYLLPETLRNEASMRSRKARFCAFACDGRVSKVALAMMSFSLKLLLCTRATAPPAAGAGGRDQHRGGRGEKGGREGREEAEQLPPRRWNAAHPALGRR